MIRTASSRPAAGLGARAIAAEGGACGLAAGLSGMAREHGPPPARGPRGSIWWQP